MSTDALDISPVSRGLQEESGTSGKGVVAITNYWPPMAAGTGHHLRGMIEGLHNTVVLAPRVNGLEAGESLQIVPILRFSGRAGGPFKVFSLLQHLEVVIAAVVWCMKPRRARPSLLVCVQPLFCGVGGLLARLLFGVPYVTLAHGEELTIMLAGGSPFRIRYRLLRATLRRASAVICNTENTRLIATRNYGVPASKLRVIYPTIATKSWAPVSDSESAELRRRLVGPNRLLLMVGRLGEPRKGFDTAIRALPDILKQVPDTTLVIAGPGDAEATGLSPLAREQGVGERVIFAGELERRELERLFGVCDLFLLPGREIEGTAEGFGLVFLEAALAGKAVVGGRAGGVAEAVIDGETGLLVDGGAPAEVARAVVRLLRDPAYAARLGARGRERVIAEFDGRRQRRQFADLVDQLLGRPEGVLS